MNRPLSVADATGVPCQLVPAELIEHQAQARAGDALSTIGMSLSLAELQLDVLAETKRNGGLTGTDMRRAILAGRLRALADALATDPAGRTEGLDAA